MYSKNYLKTARLILTLALYCMPVTAGVYFNDGGVSIQLPHAAITNQQEVIVNHTGDVVLRGLNVGTGLLRGVISAHEGYSRCNLKKPAHNLRTCGALIRALDAILFIVTHPEADHTQDLGWLVFDLVDATQCFTGCDAGTLLRKMLRIKPAEVADDMADPNEVSVTNIRNCVATIETLIGVTTPFMSDTSASRRRLLFVLRGMLSLSRHLFQKRDMVSNVLMGANGLYIAGKAGFGKFPTHIPTHIPPQAVPASPAPPAPVPAPFPAVVAAPEPVPVRAPLTPTAVKLMTKINSLAPHLQKEWFDSSRKQAFLAARGLVSREVSGPSGTAHIVAQN